MPLQKVTYEKGKIPPPCKIGCSNSPCKIRLTCQIVQVHISINFQFGMSMRKNINLYIFYKTISNQLSTGCLKLCNRNGYVVQCSNSQYF